MGQSMTYQSERGGGGGGATFAAFSFHFFDDSGARGIISLRVHGRLGLEGVERRAEGRRNQL